MQFVWLWNDFISMFTIICRRFDMIMMIVMHRILTSVISVFYTHWHELNMVLNYRSLICANVSDLEHSQTHDRGQLRSSICFSHLRGLQCCFRCVCHVVCVNLGPKAAISRGAQNCYGWRRRTLLTARLIKFYSGLRLMKSMAAYGGG